MTGEVLSHAEVVEAGRAARTRVGETLRDILLAMS